MFAIRPDSQTHEAMGIPIPERISSDHAQSLLGHSKLLAQCEEYSGLSLISFDESDRQFPVGIPQIIAGDQLPLLIDQLRDQAAAIVECHSFWIYGMRLPGTTRMAGGVLLPVDGSLSDTTRTRILNSGYHEADLQEWVRKHSEVRPELVLRLLKSSHDLVISQSQADRSIRSTESLSTRLADTYEEVVLLQDISQYLRPDIDSMSLAEAVLERVRLISDTSLSAYCLRHKTMEADLLSGDWGFDGPVLESLIKELRGVQPPRVIVRNHIDQTPLGARFPNLRSLAAVPIFETDRNPSWLVLANTVDGRELGTEEANLLKSVGGVLSAHAQVAELFKEHEDMVLAFIRSLVSTLDAKDPYTCGHSERVALVAQRIAKELQLSHSEVETVFQSGLLHDIGKIGVDDAVLRKEESLSAAEFRNIARHPEVGYAILSELRGVEDLLPGVLHHHERYDGRGYPAKLAGQAIPRIARILAVADSYDAMGSDRPYRRGMKRDDVERILANGSGTQWDPEVVQAFFQARHDIHRIWTRAIERQKQEDQPPPESRLSGQFPAMSGKHRLLEIEPTRLAETEFNALKSG